MEVTKSKEPTQGAKEEQKPELDSAIIDELMEGYQRPEDMTGPGGILEQLTKRVYELILGAENRNVQDLLIVVIDGLKGFPKPLRRFFPTPRFRPASCT